MVESAERRGEFRKIRLRRLRMAAIGWLVSVGLTYFGWWLDVLAIGLPELLVVTAIIVTAQLIFFFAIHSGWSERFHDPAMTMPHIIFAILTALYIIDNAGEARTILLLPFVIIVFFGIFQLRRDQYIMITLIATFGFALIVLAELFAAETASRRRSLLLLELGVFTTVIFWMALIGSYVSALRRKLTRTNAELRERSSSTWPNMTS